MELTEAVDGTLGLEIVILFIDESCALLSLFDKTETVEVRPYQTADLKVVDA